jgi:hypothetical protein
VPLLGVVRGRRVVVACVCAGLMIMAASAAPAGAQVCCTLTLSGPATVPVGTTITLTAAGNDQLYQSYLWVDVLPATSTTTCPAGFETGNQVATASGGGVVAGPELETQDANGNFTMLVVFKPAPVSGTVLFCAYTQGFGTDTFAMSSLLVTFQGNTTGGGGSNPGGGGGVTGTAKPANTVRPRVTRLGRQLRCVPGHWSESPTKFAYQWLVDGRAKAGASGAKLAINRRVRHQKVECLVIASNTAGSSSARSAPFSVH